MPATLGKILAAGALAALGTVMSPASGLASPISDGQSKLTLNRGLYGELRSEGVRLKGLGAGRARGRTALLPAGAGTLSPRESSARVRLRGGLALRGGGRIAKLRRLVLDTERGRLSGAIGKRPLTIALLRRVKGEPAGFGAKISVAALRLTGRSAALLNRALGARRAFRPGRSLGTLLSVLQPGTVEVTRGTIAIGGLETAFSKLGAFGVQMGTWGATGRWGGPSETYFLFSVEPAAISPDASAGIVEGAERDGVSMQIHAPPPREMLLRDPRIDLASGELTATLSPLSGDGPVRAPIATLDYGPGPNVRPGVGAIEFTAVRAIANSFVAEQLNQRFATPGTFAAGEVLARMTLTLSTR